MARGGVGEYASGYDCILSRGTGANLVAHEFAGSITKATISIDGQEAASVSFTVLDDGSVAVALDVYDTAAAPDVAGIYAESAAAFRYAHWFHSQPWNKEERPTEPPPF